MEDLLIVLADFFTAFDLNAFLNAAGDNPFLAMWMIFKLVGWIFLIWYFIWGGRATYKKIIMDRFWGAKEWGLMKINVPRASEQTCRAVENIYATVAGIHTNPSWTEVWVDGFDQSTVNFEIASTEGQVAFYIYCERRFMVMMKSAIFAQYPDAEIVEVEDYAKKVPQHYPNDEWDLWGTEMINVMPDPYPLRTYPEFEDKVSGEFKDPISGVLENFAHLGPGEHAWVQMNIEPTNQDDFRERAAAIINKVKGVKPPEPSENIVLKVILWPLRILSEAMSIVFGFGGAPEPKKEEKKDLFPKLAALSPGEKNVLEALERKAAKIGFNTKIRFLYIAKKSVMSKPRAVHAYIGAIKQMNTFDMQALKPESKIVGVNSTFWFFKDYRNNIRKNKLIARYVKRSGDGIARFFLSIEELATLWHFPILMQVRAPQLERTEAKKAEPPANIPFE